MKKTLPLMLLLLSSIVLAEVAPSVKASTVILNFTESLANGILPASFTVNQGDLLVITVHNNDTSIIHTFTIDSYADYIMGQSQTQKFNVTATHPGVFTIHCRYHPYIPHSALNVIGPSLTSSPASRLTPAGGTATYNLTVGSLVGFKGSVSFGILGDLTQVTPRFTKASVYVPQGGSNSSLLSLVVGSSKPLGDYVYNVTASNGAFFNSVNITLQVRSVVSAPISVGGAGQTASIVSNATVSNFTSNATSLSFQVSGTGTGYVNVTISKSSGSGALSSSNIQVRVSGVKVTPVISSNSTHFSAYFTLTLSTHGIVIFPASSTPTFPAPIVLALILAVAGLAIIVQRRQRLPN